MTSYPTNPYGNFEMPEAGAQRVSILAIVALVLSLLCFIPLLPMIAVVLAIAGLLFILTSRGRLRGTGLAVTALILGFLFSAIQLGLVIGAGQAISIFRREITQPVTQSLTDLDRGEFATVRQLLTPGTAPMATDAQLTAFREAYQAELGGFQGGPPEGLLGFFGAYMPLAQAMQPYQGQPNMLPMPGSFAKGPGLVVLEIDPMASQPGNLPLVNIHVVTPSGTAVSLFPSGSAGGAVPGPKNGAGTTPPTNGEPTPAPSGTP